MLARLNKQDLRRIRLYWGIAIILAILLALLWMQHSRNSARNKIALLCLDGATWNIIRPLLEKNELPHFMAAIQNGASGTLFSETAYSPPSWASIATGKSSKKHGILQFADIDKCKTKNIWNILSDFGINVGVFNWLTGPCERVNGAMYKCDLGRGSFCFFPASLGREKEIQRDTDAITRCLFRWKSIEGYRFYDVMDKHAADINKFLMRKFQPVFIAVGFHGSNPYQHRYWSALEPNYFDIEQGEVLEKRNLINEYYKKIDDFLGLLVKSNYTVILVSDHGFCRNDTRSGPRIIRYYHLNSDMQHVNLLINSLLRKQGLLTFTAKSEGGGQIDFLKTKAYYYNNARAGAGGIKINRQVVRGDDITVLRERLFSLFKNARFETKEKVFSDVELNSKDDRIDLPDVMFKLGPVLQKKDIYFKEAKDAPLHLTSVHVFNQGNREVSRIIMEGRIYNLGEFIDYSRDGVHEHNGIIIMTGKNIKKNATISKARLTDVLPTVLYLLGKPIAKDMDGMALLDAFEPSFVERHPVKFVATYEFRQDKKNNPEAIEPANGIDRDFLHSLGYVQ